MNPKYQTIKSKTYPSANNNTTVIEKIANPPPLADNLISKVYFYNNDMQEIITVHKRSNNLTVFSKLDKHRYINKQTGEIHYYNSSYRKSKNPQNIQRSLTNLHRLIDNNFFGNQSERHIVLTYAYKIDNPYRLYTDFKYFMTKLRKYHPCEYICIPEPNQDGRWHIHVLLKRLDNLNLNITHEQVNNSWTHGITHIKQMPNNSNLANYFCSFINGSSEKMRKKNSRIGFYTSNMRLYRKSRNIRSPVSYKKPRYELKTDLKEYKLKQSETKVIKSVDSIGNAVPINLITYEKYIKE